MDDPVSPTAHEGCICATCELHFKKHGFEIVEKKGVEVK
jgi:hypothetical protein